MAAGSYGTLDAIDGNNGDGDARIPGASGSLGLAGTTMSPLQVR
jgi:hypothetical protein